MNADMNSRCPEEPRAVGNRALRRCSKTRAAIVTEECSFVRCNAYAMKYGNLACE